MPDDRSQTSGKAGAEAEVLPAPEVRLAPPQRFKVLLHDDDFTTMEFVVEVLMDVFGHPKEKALQIMLNVHQLGIGLAGVFPFEIAEAKAGKVVALARANEFPFLATVEPDDDEPGQ